MGTPAQHEELEKALVEDPDDDRAYEVYADWLLERGDPRGTLIQLQLRLARATPESEEAREAQAERAALFAANEQLEPRFEGEPFDVEWSRGFIKAAKVPVSSEAKLSALLHHPSASLLQELTVWAVGKPGRMRQALWSAFRGYKARGLRRLRVKCHGDDLGQIRPLLGGLPRLQLLDVRCATLKLRGHIELPELRVCRINAGAFRSWLRPLMEGSWPSLRSLALRLNYQDELHCFEPLFEGRIVPRLRHLGLIESTRTDALCQALAGSDLIAQIRRLDLKWGRRTNKGGAQALVDRMSSEVSATHDMARLDMRTETWEAPDPGAWIGGRLLVGEHQQEMNWGSSSHALGRHVGWERDENVMAPFGWERVAKVDKADFSWAARFLGKPLVVDKHSRPDLAPFAGCIVGDVGRSVGLVDRNVIADVWSPQEPAGSFRFERVSADAARSDTWKAHTLYTYTSPGDGLEHVIVGATREDG